MKIYPGGDMYHPVIYGADFETDRDGDTSFICQWALAPTTTPLEEVREGKHPFAWTGKDLESFYLRVVGRMFEVGHILIYFHNLRYDQSYFFPMMEWLVERHDLEEFHIVKEGHPIIISFQSKEKKPKFSVTFRDSLQKMPFKLKEIGKMLGVSKLMPPDGDFHEGWSKSIDYSNMKYDQPDWKYVAMDAYICGTAMQMLHDEGYIKATASSDALYACKLAVNDGKLKWKKSFDTKWDRYFPPLPVVLNAEGMSKEEYSAAVGDALVDDLTIREAYWGGINYSAHKGVHVASQKKRIYHIDYHSMYPSQMKFRPLPYRKCKRKLVSYLNKGGPLKPKRDYDPDSETYFAQVRVTSMKVRPDRVPWYHLKDPDARREEGLRSSDAVVELHHPVTITVCELELWDLIDFYDIEFTTEPDPDRPTWKPTYWIFDTAVGILGPHVDRYYAEKEKEEREKRKNGLMYNQAKLMMNSVYGKLSQYPQLDDTEMVFDDELEWYRWKVTGEHINEDFDSYIPYGSCITAWARHQLLQAWKAVGCENVIHSDTDSVIFMGEKVPDGLNLTPSTLDTWGNEEPKGGKGGDIFDSDIVRLYEFGVKRYIEYTHYPPRSLKDVSMAMAGVPQDKYTFTDEKGESFDVPVGMWVELLDDPDRFIPDGFSETPVLGQTDYRIRSAWIRELYHKAGIDPDHVNTMKNVTHMGKGGIQIDPTTFEFKDNIGMRIR